MKKWKKIFMTAAVMGTAFSFGTITASAGYQLSSEVKAPTKALKAATEMGVLKYENPQMQYLPDKDAILVMTFGTTYKETRQKTIDATIDAIKAKHPGVNVVTAYTSHIIIDRVKKNEGTTYPTPEEALDQLKKEGYTRVALTTLDLIPGVEYAYDLGVFHHYKNSFKKMTIGTSLMYWQGQEEQPDDVAETIKALSSQFPKQTNTDAVLIMAHGTPHVSNAYYSLIQAKIDEAGYKNVYIYTVEGWPSLETVLPKLKQKGIKHVTLMPMMMVAGDHASNDMAGAEDDSHKSVLQKAGYKVDVYLHGIGENKNIRDLYVKRATDAWDALTK